MSDMNTKTPLQAAGVMYQIYPRSFYDADGDGTGDIKGIIQKLDYLKDLGVNSLWISPIYKSPMADFGYDVSDYCDIDPTFGTLDDFDELVREAHKRGMKLVMDYVANHTSDQHPWFLESKSSRDSAKRDWYIWKDPGPDGGPPNNWLSIFGGLAWEFDETTQQYYMHTFLKEQPELNWQNPEVKDAMLNVLRFWIDRGVDGFRADAFAHISKDVKFRDEPVNPHFRHGDWSWTKLQHIYMEQKDGLKYIYEYFDSVFAEYPDRELFMVTEDYAGMDDIKWHYENSNSQSFAPLNLWFTELEWDHDTVQRYVYTYDSMLQDDMWPNYALGNHDLTRVSNRAGKDALRTAAMLQLTLRGMPIIYYGEELGMSEVEIPRDRMRDPAGLRDETGKVRDPQRTPMQWGASTNAGFTTGVPWLPIANDFKMINVENQTHNQQSLLQLYKDLIKLRNSTKAFSEGDLEKVEQDNRYVMMFKRFYEDEVYYVAINLSKSPQKVVLHNHELKAVLKTHEKAVTLDDTSFTLEPSAGVIFV
jgi:alpha-glucosidase